jgi:hypothetical protein
MNLCVHIKNKSKLNYMYMKWDSKIHIKFICRLTCYILVYVPKINEKSIYLLGIV